MTDMENPGGPLAFAASFPPDERYAPTAADLAARLAAAAGCGEAAAEDFRLVVDEAFRAVLAGDRPVQLSIDVSFRASAASFDADLSCGSERLLHCSRPRSA
jgi:anti-sigma regulatory factor (Ser/Thr protein kinase)